MFKNLDELKQELANDDVVRVAALDVEGILRGKIMNKKKFLALCAAETPAFGFCGVVYGWDMHDATYRKELKISNYANGYADILARIDLNTFRRLPFENNLPFFLCTFLDPNTQELLYACPRATLQKVLKQLDEGLGYKAYSGIEYEYFQFSETPASVADKKFRDLVPLTPGNHGYSLLRTQLNKDYFHDIYTDSAKFGIEIEAHHTETGPGVYETALAYTDAATIADNATLFKFVAKSVGMRHGVIPTFMAKPHGNEAGCSGHTHISLRNASGENIFAVKEPRTDTKYDDLKWVSKECEHFLAGLLHGMPDIVPFMLPTVNSYKRLVESYWAPVTVSWAYESRLASIRVIGQPISPASATRLEVRLPGADVQPHYCLSAIIALGMYGIKNKLEVPIPPVSDPNAPESRSIKVPKNLKEATERMMAKDSWARKVLGDDLVDHFGETRLHEWTLFEQTVTEWEVARYLELA